MASSPFSATCGSVTKTYNSKKAIFLYKHATTGQYSAIHRSFILSSSVNRIIGQFITTNWFKIAGDTNKSITFGIAWVDEDTSCSTVEEYVNNVSYDKFYKFNQFTIDTDQLKETFHKLVNNENDTRSLTVSCTYPVNGYHVFSVNARLHYKPGNETCEQDTLLISLPTFEYDPILF